MSDCKNKSVPDAGRRKTLGLLAGAIPVVAACSAEDKATTRNSLLWAVAWKQTAAEYFALCHQAFNLARLRVESRLSAGTAGKPLAVITDVDDTILHARSYWGYLVEQDLEFFDDAIWDAWLPDFDVTPAPGALDFFRWCEQSDVAVFYATNRDQGDDTFDLALRQLRHLEFPFADEEHLFVFRDTSNKTPAREAVEENYDIAVMLGDNLNDYRRDYYVTDIEERLALMERDREQWGRDFILLPNPTDGHWVRAIFGDSEPPPTAENRQRLRDAAKYRSWRGPRV